MEKHAHKATLFVKKGVVKLQNVWMRVSCKCRNFRTKLCPGTSYRGIAERACMRKLSRMLNLCSLSPMLMGFRAKSVLLARWRTRLTMLHVPRPSSQTSSRSDNVKVDGSPEMPSAEMQIAPSPVPVITLNQQVLQIQSMQAANNVQNVPLSVTLKETAAGEGSSTVSCIASPFLANFAAKAIRFTIAARLAIGTNVHWNKKCKTKTRGKSIWSQFP